MGGIANVLIVQSISTSQPSGKLGNSLIFGQNAFNTTLVSGDSLKMSSLQIDNMVSIGTLPFTIEYWIKFKNLTFYNQFVHENGQVIFGGPSITGSLAVVHRFNSVYINNYLIGNNILTIPSAAIPSQSWQLDTWYHVAISRNASNQLTMHVNGYRSPAGAVVNGIDYFISSNSIGTWRNLRGAGTTNNFIGYLFGYRINIGSNVYDPTQSVVQVPKTAVAVLPDTKLLMISPNGNPYGNLTAPATVSIKTGIVGQSKDTPYSDEIILQGAQYNAISPFASQRSGSIRFFGNITNFGYLLPSSDFALGTQDFTIEWFSYKTDNNSNSTIWWYGTTAAPIYGFSYVTSGINYYITFYHNGTSLILASLLKTTIDNQWAHWALVRINGVMKLYRNGISLTPSGVSNPTNYSNSSETFYIAKRGQSALAEETFGGYFSNLRIIKGKGIYTDTFTTPTDNLQRVDIANPFGGANTLSVRSDQVKRLLVP